jgi:hypothetical protein
MFLRRQASAPALKTAFRRMVSPAVTARVLSGLEDLETGAGDEIRTHDPNLGKVVLYH